MRKIKLKNTKTGGGAPVPQVGELLLSGQQLRLGNGVDAFGNLASAGAAYEQFTQKVITPAAGYTQAGSFGINPSPIQELEVYRGDNMLADYTGGDETKDYDVDLYTTKCISLKNELGATGAIDLVWWAFFPDGKTLMVSLESDDEDPVEIKYYRGSTQKSITVTWEQPVMFVNMSWWTPFQGVAQKLI